jgi:N-sulfoglucosamine sulfohydrolase
MRLFKMDWVGAVLLFVLVPALGAREDRPNMLLITVDDMSCDSVGVYGCKVEGTTPQMDRLAGRSMRFAHAFVQVGNCMPSRNVMWSGRYPHNNGVEGFYQVKEPGYPVLADLFLAAGYYTGIRGKVSHSTPYHPYPAWSVVLDEKEDGSRAHQKDAESYYESVQRGIRGAGLAGKPFCLNINISDPHKPFYNEGKGEDPHVPSRVFTAEEVAVPGFLFEDQAVREELALYYSSVRRADDCVGAVLRALEESGEEERTIVLFLSDHGMPLPFAKTQLYFHSARTPLMLRWPGVTRDGAVDEEHLVSAVDLLPTLLEMVGLPLPAGMDGRSFAPLLRGERQDGRDFVVAEYNENSGGDRSPMRSIITRDLAYLFNPWSNGQRVMRTATHGTVTYRRMKALAAGDAEIAQRLKLLDHRVPEELYDYRYDPDALSNLIASAKHQAALKELTSRLEGWMVATGDPLLGLFRQRHDAEALETAMVAAQQEALERHRGKSAGSGGRAGPVGGDYLEVDFPREMLRKGELAVTVKHALHADFGPQKLHVTLKGFDNSRIERQTQVVSGVGEVTVSFSLPGDYKRKRVSVAVLLGEDIKQAMQHLQSEPIEVK